MLGSRAGAVNPGESRGGRRRRRMKIVMGRRRTVERFLGQAGGSVERRRGRDEVENVGITSLSVSSVVEMAATEVLNALVKTLTCSFQSLVVS